MIEKKIVLTQRKRRFGTKNNIIINKRQTKIKNVISNRVLNEKKNIHLSVFLIYFVVNDKHKHN